MPWHQGLQNSGKSKCIQLSWGYTYYLIAHPKLTILLNLLSHKWAKTEQWRRPPPAPLGANSALGGLQCNVTGRSCWSLSRVRALRLSVLGLHLLEGLLWSLVCSVWPSYLGLHSAARRWPLTNRSVSAKGALTREGKGGGAAIYIRARWRRVCMFLCVLRNTPALVEQSRSRRSASLLQTLQICVQTPTGLLITQENKSRCFSSWWSWGLFFPSCRCCPLQFSTQVRFTRVYGRKTCWCKMCFIFFLNKKVLKIKNAIVGHLLIFLTSFQKSVCTRIALNFDKFLS